MVGVCPKSTVIDGAPLTDGATVDSFGTRDSVECHNVTATADDLYVLGPTGVYGCGMYEYYNATDWADTAIIIPGKVSGGVLGGAMVVCGLTAERSW